MHRLWPLLFVGACGIPCQDPADVPIRGADAVDELELRTLLAQFGRWTGFENDQVCVRRIVVRDEERLWSEDTAIGGSFRSDGRLELYPHPDVSWQDRQLSFTHELCHGLDTVRDITTAHPGLFDYDRRAGEPWTGEKLEREAFAKYCEVGPVLLSEAIAHIEACWPELDPEPYAVVLDEAFQGDWVGDPFLNGLSVSRWVPPEGDELGGCPAADAAE